MGERVRERRREEGNEGEGKCELRGKLSVGSGGEERKRIR